MFTDRWRPFRPRDGGHRNTGLEALCFVLEGFQPEGAMRWLLVLIVGYALVFICDLCATCGSTPRFALFAEEEAEVVQGQGAGEAFFAEDVFGQDALASEARRERR